MKLSKPESKLKKSVALILFVFLVRLCHLFGRGGASFPGDVAIKICPGIISDIIEGKKSNTCYWNEW